MRFEPTPHNVHRNINTQLRSTIGRSSNSTTDGGGLFPTQESVLDKNVSCLTIYSRVEPEFVGLFWRLVQELAHWGFGSDRSAGKGQFRLDSQLEPADELDAPADADGCVVLSTFQPAAGDPTEGAWDAFTKYGKLGPDFGLENVFKRPMVVFRPGACFRDQAPCGWMGRAIPMHELLAEDVVDHLNGRGASVVHWAFGLCVPLIWPNGEFRLPEPATNGPLTLAQPSRTAFDKKHEEEKATTAPATFAQPSRAEPQIPQPPPRTQQGADTVAVKVLERREIGGKVQFFVQEAGKPRGVLAYGTPPPEDKLPQVGEEIAVYRNNRDARNPQYRWDKPLTYQDKPRGGPGGQRPRGRR